MFAKLPQPKGPVGPPTQQQGVGQRCQGRHPLGMSVLDAPNQPRTLCEDSIGIVVVVARNRLQSNMQLTHSPLIIAIVIASHPCAWHAPTLDNSRQCISKPHTSGPCARMQPSAHPDSTKLPSCGTVQHAKQPGDAPAPHRTRVNATHETWTPSTCTRVASCRGSSRHSLTSSSEATATTLDRSAGNATAVMVLRWELLWRSTHSSQEAGLQQALNTVLVSVLSSHWLGSAAAPCTPCTIAHWMAVLLPLVEPGPFFLPLGPSLAAALARCASPMGALCGTMHVMAPAARNVAPGKDRGAGSMQVCNTAPGTGRASENNNTCNTPAPVPTTMHPALHGWLIGHHTQQWDDKLQRESTTDQALVPGQWR